MSKKSPAQRALAQRTKQEMIEGGKVSRSWGKRGKRTLAQKKRHSRRRHTGMVFDPVLQPEKYEPLPADPIAGMFLPKQVIAGRDLANSYFDPVIIPRWKALELGLHGVTYGQ